MLVPCFECFNPEKVCKYSTQIVECRDERDPLNNTCVPNNYYNTTKLDETCYDFLSKCRRLRYYAEVDVAAGESVDWVPQCDNVTNHFEPMQCDSTQTECWCVDLIGIEVIGTRDTYQVRASRIVFFL